MNILVIVVVVVVVVGLLGSALSARIVTQYEQGVLFRLGRLRGPRAPGLKLSIPVVFPAPLMSTIAELGSFLASEQAAARPLAAAGPVPPPQAAAANGTAIS
jgi:regulator of protease activity HflC (stomatin/prohibitin superfamily)